MIPTCLSGPIADALLLDPPTILPWLFHADAALGHVLRNFRIVDFRDLASAGFRGTWLTPTSAFTDVFRMRIPQMSCKLPSDTRSFRAQDQALTSHPMKIGRGVETS